MKGKDAQNISLFPFDNAENKQFQNYLETEGSQFENKLKREKNRKYNVQDIEKLGVHIWLVVKLHCQAKRIN